MENTNRDTAQGAAPQKEWQDTNERYYAAGNTYNPDEEEEVDSDAQEEESGDWGHTDPAEGNSPFPSSNDPSGPGSAV